MSTIPPPAGSSEAPKRSTSQTTPLLVGLIALFCVGAVAYLGLRNSAGSEGSALTTQLGDISCTTAPALPASPQAFATPPDPSLAEGAIWMATVETNCGDIRLELYGDKAPQTVASFVFLAEHDFWADSPCQRLTTAGIFVLQCGDPTGSGTGGPGYTFGVENAPADGNYPAGTLAMARATDPNSNGSQFFIVYADTTLPTEGGGYSIFGQVTVGLDIVEAIANQGVIGGREDGAPAQPLSILDVSVQRQ